MAERNKSLKVREQYHEALRQRCFAHNEKMQHVLEALIAAFVRGEIQLPRKEDEGA